MLTVLSAEGFQDTTLNVIWWCVFSSGDYYSQVHSDLARILSMSQIIIIIIIIIKLCWLHWFPWLSIAFYHNWPSLLVGSLDGIKFPKQTVLTSISMSGSLRENIACEFTSDSLAVPSMSCLSCLDGLWDGRQVAVQLLFCRMLLSRFVQNSMQHPCVVLS